MDLLNIITLAVLGLILLVVYRGKNDNSKDAISHATVDSSLAERQRSKEEELKKMDQVLSEIEKEVKDKTPKEIEEFWNGKK